MAMAISELQKKSELHSVALGKGEPPIIMLHGWGQSVNSLWGLADLLSKSRRVYLIDLPGFGQSKKPDDDWDTGQYADRILKFMNENKIEGADLFGHSFGGRIAIRLTAKAGDRVHRFILIGTPGLPRQLTGKALRRMQIAKVSGKICRWLDQTFGLDTFQTWQVPRFGSRDYKNSGELKNIFVKTINENLSTVASVIKNETLLLWGEKDDEAPLEIGERYAKIIPNSKLIVLPGKDHFPFLNEGAHLCAYHILNFLNGPTHV